MALHFVEPVGDIHSFTLDIPYIGLVDTIPIYVQIHNKDVKCIDTHTFKVPAELYVNIIREKVAKELNLTLIPRGKN